MSGGSVALGFEHGAGFVAGEVSGGFGLGPLESQYEELFADALADGVITPEERQRLEKAADNLGIDPQRLLRLEQAMVAAYQTRHRVQIIEHYEDSAPSLAPLRVPADGDAGRTLLLKQIEKLEARVKQLEAELRKAQASINVEVDLSEVESAAQDASEDADEIWRRVRRDPKNPDGYRALSRVYAARHERDRRFCVAQVLCSLSAANPEERALVEQFRSHGLIRARASISPKAWVDLLFHPEEESAHRADLQPDCARGVGRSGDVTAPRQEVASAVRSTKQDPAKATITAVRALPWAGCDPWAWPRRRSTSRRTVIQATRSCRRAAVHGHRQASAIGRTQLEHAFMVGRHLSWYRQEHYLKTLFSGVPDLEDLFLAALTIGNPGLPSQKT
jgi:hypothetical protein